MYASALGESRKRIAAEQRKENAVFLGMESGWRTERQTDFIKPSARPQLHWNGVTPKFCVKSIERRNRAKFICRRQRLDRLPPMSTT